MRSTSSASPRVKGWMDSHIESVRICWSASCFDASHCSGKQLPCLRLYANQESGFSNFPLSLVPGGAKGRPGSVRGLSSARWPCLASGERTPSSIPLISHGPPHPAKLSANWGPIKNKFPFPTLNNSSYSATTFCWKTSGRAC